MKYFVSLLKFVWMVLKGIVLGTWGFLKFNIRYVITVVGFWPVMWITQVFALGGFILCEGTPFITTIVVDEKLVNIMVGGIIAALLEELWKYAVFQSVGRRWIFPQAPIGAWFITVIVFIVEFVNYTYSIVMLYHLPIDWVIMMRIPPMGIHLITISVYCLWSEGAWPRNWPHPLLVGILIHTVYNYVRIDV